MYSHGIASAHWPPEPGWNGSIRTTLSTTGQKRHKTFQMFASLRNVLQGCLEVIGAQTPTSRTKSPGEFRWCSSCAENTKCPSAWNVTQFAVFIVGFHHDYMTTLASKQAFGLQVGWSFSLDGLEGRADWHNLNQAHVRRPLADNGVVVGPQNKIQYPSSNKHQNWLQLTSLYRGSTDN